MDPLQFGIKESSLNVTGYLSLFLVCTLLAWFTQFEWKKHRLNKLVEKIPGPKTLPIFGNVHLLLEDGGSGKLLFCNTYSKV